MEARKLKVKTDEKGHLKVVKNLEPNQEYLLIPFEVEYDDDLDTLDWRDTVRGNPAFDFLKHPDEAIYTMEDGEPLNYKSGN